MERDTESDSWYGALFCRTGHELEAARNMELAWNGVTARAVSVIKRRSHQGTKSLHSEVVFPGYVFFRAPKDFQIRMPLPGKVWGILKTMDGSWMLSGRDAWFAKWVLSQNGEIGLSEAYIVGDRIQIRRGPLKDLEGYIVRVDRRNKGGQVELNVNGRSLRVWLGFEWLDDAEHVRKTLLAQDEKQGAGCDA